MLAPVIFLQSRWKTQLKQRQHRFRFTAEDDCAGLPDADLLETSPRDLKLFHPGKLPQKKQLSSLAALRRRPSYRQSVSVTVMALVCMRSSHISYRPTRAVSALAMHSLATLYRWHRSPVKAPTCNAMIGINSHRNAKNWQVLKQSVVTQQSAP